DSFIIDRSASYDPAAYPKFEGWKVDREKASDCCLWDGIGCDDITGHVISLDLSSSCLFGSINSSSSLFQLLHLRSLNLADNDFYGSLIPSALGHLLTNLTHLNLSYSAFSGPIPSSISNLSKLSSLDLSVNAGLEIRNPDFKALVRKLDNLQVLHLDLVDMSSTVPNDILAISSSLVSLSLRECYLQGEFPTRIFQLPKLEVLVLDTNPNLTGHLPEFHSTTPLRKLSVSDCNLSGRIPSSLQNLTQLVYLNLGANSFSVQDTSSLSWMGHLAKLTHLSLESSNLTGEIPSSFANLTNLSILNLRWNQLTGPMRAWLGNLTQLTAFYASQNELQGMLPKSLSELRKLEILELSYNKLNGPVEFRELHKLYYLDLSWNFLSSSAKTSLNDSFSMDEYCDKKFEGWNQASDCCLWDGIECDDVSGHVITLDLTSSRLSGSINSSSSLFQLLHLRSLNLAFNHFDYSSIPSVLGHLLPNLAHLNLSYSMFSGPIPSSISNLSKLSSLDLSGNVGLGHIPSSLQNLTQLVYLGLGGNSFGVQDTSSLSWMGHLAKLTHLYLDHSNLSGEIPSSFANLTNLSVLDLSSNQLAGPLSTWMGNLAELTYLSLGSSNLTGEIPSSFGNLTNLSVLDISFNHLAGPLSTWLGNLTQLTEFWAQYNELQGTVPRSLLEFRNLEVLDLSHNKLNGPVEFRELQKLYHLDLSGNFLSLNAKTNINATFPKL
ncbi:hypothetical protein Tsubulata_019789, partial [Turnera subulata]